MGWGLWVGTLEGSGGTSHVDKLALRAVFLTLMSTNWPLMSVNVFFVGYGANAVGRVSTIQNQMGFDVPPFLARGRHLADEASRRGC